MAAFLVTSSTLPYYPGKPPSREAHASSCLLRLAAGPTAPRAEPVPTLSLSLFPKGSGAGFPTVSLGVRVPPGVSSKRPLCRPSACTDATSQLGGDTPGSVPLGRGGSRRAPTRSVTCCPHVLRCTGPAAWQVLPRDVGDARVGAAGSCTGEGDLAGGCMGGEAMKGLRDPRHPPQVVCGHRGGCPG